MNTRSNNLQRHTLMSGASAVAMAAALALTSAPARAAEIDEIIVTARKRSENLQDVPSSVQALPASFLEDLGAQSMDDFVRFIPSMTAQSFTGAAGAQVVFRGITTGGDFIAQAPSSVYLDETAVTTTGEQPNLRLIDVNRVEALAGPQGTLYGASAQAGTLRIYTNQPDTSAFEGSLDMTMKIGSDSDISHDIIGVVNIPIVENKLAIRVAVNSGVDGGFIDNVFGHTPDSMYGGIPGSFPDEFGTLTNANIVEENQNSTEFFTAVIGLRWEIDDDWTATLSRRYSENTSHGANFFNPFVGDLEVVQFNKSLREEEWDVSSLVIEGDLGWAQLVSSTSFYNRDKFYNIDATAYMRYYAYWGCTDRGFNTGYYWNTTDPANGNSIYYAQYCLGADAHDDWTGILVGPESQDKFSQEIRLSAQGEDFDWLLGVYYEDANDDWDSVWMVPGYGAQTYPNTLGATYWRDVAFVNGISWLGIDPAPANDAIIPQIDDAIAGLLTSDRTKWNQKAVFGEVTWHIRDDLDFTVGGRYFVRTNEKSYLAWHLATGSFRDPKGLLLKTDFTPDKEAGRIHKGEDKEFVPKVSVKFDIDEDKMVYATYTQGFRPGGTNRARGNAPNADGTCDFTNCFLFPVEYDPDTVTNYEIGSKMRFANNTLQINASLFYMEWDDYQLELLDPSNAKCGDADALDAPFCDGKWQKVVTNVGEAHTKGVQVEALWVPSDSWDLGGNVAWLEAEIDEDFAEAGQARGPSAFGTIEAGQKLPNTPEWKGSAWANYSWTTPFADMTLRGQASYVGSSFSDVVPTDPNTFSPFPNLKQDAYTIVDISLSMKLDHGTIRLFVNNVTDERAMIAHAPDKFGWVVGHSTEYERMDRIYTNRPREVGARYIYRWGG